MIRLAVVPKIFGFDAVEVVDFRAMLARGLGPRIESILSIFVWAKILHLNQSSLLGALSTDHGSWIIAWIIALSAAWITVVRR